jgi:CBS domain-containing protein
MAVAAAIMTKAVTTVSPETSVQKVAALLSSNCFGSLPVVDARGRVLGIISETNMVRRAAEIHLPRHLEFLGSIIYLDNPQRFTEEAKAILALTAQDIMEKQFAATRPDVPVAVIATRLLAEDLRRLLVVDADGILLGIITRADIVRQLASRESSPDSKA